MPYVECHIATGLTQARKTQLIRDIVKVTHESIGSNPKIINVLLFEHPAENMSISGRIHGEEPKYALLYLATKLRRIGLLGHSFGDGDQ